MLAHGTAVGLPCDDDMGNSEVGHNALGAGRVFDQGAKLVGGAIESGRSGKAPRGACAVGTVRQSGGALHFIGLLSDGNVHSHIDHLSGDDRARPTARRPAQVRVHVLLDGRDVAETSALDYIDQLEAGARRLATAHGRDYRDWPPAVAA